MNEEELMDGKVSGTLAGFQTAVFEVLCGRYILVEAVKYAKGP